METYGRFGRTYKVVNANSKLGVAYTSTMKREAICSYDISDIATDKTIILNKSPRKASVRNKTKK
jgi:hypothetical protein